MPKFTDPEFGEITVQKRSLANNVSVKIAPNGTLRVTIPTYAPLFAAKTLIKTSRTQIRKLIAEHQTTFSYTHDQPIGKSHHLLIQNTTGKTRVKTTGTQIIAQINHHEDPASPINQQLIRDKIITALRKESKSYLPRRLSFLAEQHGFFYVNTKITHASSRWGSCSSRGTISLNIGLMNLPFELIDYVIIHELCHTRHMNHSTKFWNEVAKFDPLYKAHRNALKNHSPHV